MKTFLKNFVRDESGASAAEYALILAVISGLLVVAGTLLSENIAQAIGDVACTIGAGSDTTATVDTTNGTVAC